MPIFENSSAEMKKRSGIFNTKRQFAGLARWPPDRLKDLCNRLSYGGNLEQRRELGDFNLNSTASARMGKTLCDEVGVRCRQDALALLRSGVAAGLISEPCINAWPQKIWTVYNKCVLASACWKHS